MRQKDLQIPDEEELEKIGRRRRVMPIKQLNLVHFVYGWVFQCADCNATFFPKRKSKPGEVVAPSRRALNHDCGEQK